MAAASNINPIYTVKISTGTKVYNVSKAITDLVISHNESDFSQKVSVSIANVIVDKQQFVNLVALKNTLYVYCNTGSGAKEVFRGYIWTKEYDEELQGSDIRLVAYDRLIYLQNSKDNLYFAKGKSTKTVLSDIAKKWGVTLSYKYSSITHGKLVFRAENLADIIIETLDKVKKKTGKKYAIRCDKGTMIIEPYGSNTTIYKLEKKKNAISTSYSTTMDGMITKVLIIGNEDKNDKSPNLATVKGNTSTYGTLQEVISKSDDDKLSEIKKEAQQTIKDNGSPKTSITVRAVDNPNIKKGHKIYLYAGIMKNYYHVLGIEHDCISKEMTLEVEKA